MLLNCFKHDDEMLAELKRIDGHGCTQGRAFEALKAIRGLYPIEDQYTQQSQELDACDGGTDTQGDRAMAVSGVNNTSNSYTPTVSATDSAGPTPARRRSTTRASSSCSWRR
jgi:hypothetical protein